jgi:hypothetical protein
MIRGFKFGSREFKACRLRQQNPAAASLWRGLFQLCRRAAARRAKVASGCAGLFFCFLKRKSLKTGCLESLIVEQALEQTRSVCLRAF